METMEQPKIVTENDAFQKIQECKQQCSTMGANSYEFSAFNEIENALREKTISPEEAVKMAYDVVNSKEDYH